MGLNRQLHSYLIYIIFKSWEGWWNIHTVTKVIDHNHVDRYEAKQWFSLQKFLGIFVTGDKGEFEMMLGLYYSELSLLFF